MAKGFASQPDRPLSNGRMKVASVTSATALTEQFQDYFELEDPRVERTRAHLLIDIIVMAILAVIAGAKGWEDIENYAISKQDWLAEFLTLPNGIPGHDTFRRVERLNPQVLSAAFNAGWSPVKELGALPIDGKTPKGHMIEKRSALPVCKCLGE